MTTYEKLENLKIPCRICKKPFLPRSRIQKICPNPECKKENQRQRSAEQSARVTADRIKARMADPSNYIACEECGKMFWRQQPNHKACSKECSDKRCFKIYRRAYKERKKKISKKEIGTGMNPDGTIKEYYLTRHGSL